MKLTLEKFKVKLLEQIQKQYPESYIENGEIIIVKYNKAYPIPIPVEYAYSEDITNDTLKKIAKGYIDALEQMIHLEENPKPVDYHNIYPIIRNKEFGKDDCFEFIRKQYILDLDIFVAEDYGCYIRYYGKNDNIDETKAFEAAMFNINRMKNELHQPQKELNIFGAKTETDYAACLMLNDNFRKQIREKIGRTFLIAIPSSSWIAVAPNQSQYIPLLQEVIRLNDDPNIISSRVYRIKGNKWEYAD